MISHLKDMCVLCLKSFKEKFVLLGAVPFRRDVTRLQKLGVHGVITLNEPFETLVPSSMYKSRGIDHLVIPTRDYMFAPSLADINQAIDFIHRNASCGKITYIHCKAGRGWSTTIVLCYLVKYKNMTPAAAFEHVRSKRARVLLTHSQWKAVQEFSKKNAELPALTSDSATASPARDVVRVTVADLNGNDAPEFLTEDASLSSHKTTLSRPMIKMLSCLFPSRILSMIDHLTSGVRGACMVAPVYLRSGVQICKDSGSIPFQKGKRHQHWHQ